MYNLDTKELSDQFLSENNNVNKYPFTNGKIFQFCNEKKKDFFDITDEEFVEFFYDFLKINSINTLNCYRMTYSKFYEWCILHKYTDRRNIFEESVFLDADTLADYMAKKCSMYFFDDSDIDFISMKTSESPVLSEALIRCFYEGIASYDELIHLKKEQVDLVNNTISLKDRRIKITGRLSLLLNKLIMGEVEIEEGKNGYQLQRLLPDDVFLFRITKDTDVNRKQFLKRRLEKVSEKAKIKVTSKVLYQSGLFQCIKKSCENEDMFIKLLYEDKYKQTNFVLGKILEENGYSVKSNRVRYMFKPYIMQLIATRE